MPDKPESKKINHENTKGRKHEKKTRYLLCFHISSFAIKNPFDKPVFGIIHPFRILNFGHWNLFVIWSLLFGI